MDRFLERVEATFVDALAYLAEALDVSVRRDLGFDEVDADVLIGQIDCAGRHAINVLLNIRPDLVGAAPDEVAGTLAHLAKRYGVKLDCRCASARGNLLNLVCSAIEACLDAVDVAGSRRGPKVGTVIHELGWAACHLQNARYLLDPQMFRRAMDDATPEERVRLAAAGGRGARGRAEPSVGAWYT